MSMKIITGSTGSTHVTSNNDGELQQAVFGTGLTVLNIGNKLAATIVDNNHIRIADGDLVFQGRHALIEPGTTEDITITSGVANTKRIDVIAVRYEMNTSTGYESITLKVYKGTQTSGTPTAPKVTSGNIRTGSKVAEAALFNITLNGINVESVKMVPSVTPILASEISSLKSSLNTVNTKLTKFDELTTDIKAIKVVSTLPATGVEGTLYLCTT